MQPGIADDTVPQADCELLKPDDCPVDTTLAVISGRWKPLILYHLAQGPARFNVLRRLIPALTQRTLTAHLRELEADGLISRTVQAVVPPNVTYALTAHGRTLLPVIEQMADWGRRHRALVEASAGRAWPEPADARHSA